MEIIIYLVDILEHYLLLICFYSLQNVSLKSDALWIGI